MNHFSFSTLIFFYRNNSVTPINQLLACLRLYATGGYLDQIADYMGMHLATVSRIVVRVSEAIAQLYNVYIGFPNTENDTHNPTTFL
jgi:DNA-binding MarR family transcriptional regulator